MKKTNQPTNDTAEFRNFIELLGIYTETHNRLEEIQNEANKSLLSIVDDEKDEYAELSLKLTQTAEAVEVAARQHPEWFGEKKSVATPYGTAKLTDSSSLEVVNEELSRTLIEQEEKLTPGFNPENYLRRTVELNLEALGALDDSMLVKFRIKRMKKSNFKVEPAKVKMGKGAAKQQQQQPQQQAA